MKKDDQIFIRGQRVMCHIGVPDTEREQAQGVMIDTCLSPSLSMASGDDEIASTVDYHAVSIRIEEVAKSRPRKLIETLAEDLAAMVLAEFAVGQVTIEIRKSILPNTDCVGVRISRGNS